MAVFITLATKEGAKLFRRDRPGERPSDNLENYLSPASEIEVYCTTDERECFETDNEIALTADVIEDGRDFSALLKYLGETYKLKAI